SAASRAIAEVSRPPGCSRRRISGRPSASNDHVSRLAPPDRRARFDTGPPRRAASAASTALMRGRGGREGGPRFSFGSAGPVRTGPVRAGPVRAGPARTGSVGGSGRQSEGADGEGVGRVEEPPGVRLVALDQADRKSTRLNSSHV